MNYPLNLPPVELRVRMDADGVRRVYDPLRAKFVALTPEEFVRRHFTSFMINQLGYPQALMANEVSLKINDTARRCDTVVYDRVSLLTPHTPPRPLVIVEYKAPGVEITPKVFDQIARYNLVMGARLLIVSNGLHHYCCLAHPSRPNSYRFLPEIPGYQSLVSLVEAGLWS